MKNVGLIWMSYATRREASPGVVGLPAIRSEINGGLGLTQSDGGRSTDEGSGKRLGLVARGGTSTRL